MADKFGRNYSDYQGPGTDGFDITPSDVTVFSQPTRAIYVGGSGNITVQMSATTNTVLSFNNLNAGTMLPIRVSKVFANSTATGLVGVF